jgi:hypothetical protein
MERSMSNLFRSMVPLFPEKGTPKSTALKYIVPLFTEYEKVQLTLMKE